MLLQYPPYYDVYGRTLKIKYPKNLKEDEKSILKGLLENNPKQRLGSKGIQDIKNHPFFSEIN